MKLYLCLSLILAATVANATEATSKEKRKPAAAEGMPYSEGSTRAVMYGKFTDGDVTCYYVSGSASDSGTSIHCLRPKDDGSRK